PEAVMTQMPARAGIAHGGIQRSKKYPNCSLCTNWTQLGDKITWDEEVWESGSFGVTSYATCPPADVGSTVELSMNDDALQFQITEAHDPLLRGMENDRVLRLESYVKDFRKMKLGTVQLEKGRGTLELKALDIPGKSVMDFRLLVF